MAMDSSLLDRSAARSVSSIEEGSMLLSSGEEASSVAATRQGDGESKPPTKKRKNSIRKPRTKGLQKNLQDQIEFYFGDANLPKDKFLLQTMEENEGYVPVEVVASFKKMQSLSKDFSLILKAIKNSSMLELSKDSKMLRRLSPLPDTANSDVDLRTVYVENLIPSTTDHDSVKKIFKSFGDVTFVSLPRHKISGVVKGFAFVEFSSQETANKAVEYFKDKNTISPPQTSQKLSSTNVTSSEGDAHCNKDMGALKVETGALTREMETGTGEMKETRTTEKRGKKGVTKEAGGLSGEIGGSGSVENSSGEVVRRGVKRIRDNDDGESKTCDSIVVPDPKSPPPPAKRPKKNKKPADISLEESSIQNKEAGEASKTGEGVASKTSDDDVEKKEGGKKKRNRQHRKKQWMSSLKDLDLKVMHKTEWTKLKETFKTIQKSHMQQVKSLAKASSKPPSKGFVKDCLVRVELKQEWEESQTSKLQEFCEEFGEVAYIDLKDGVEMGYIRFKSSGCVEGLLESDAKPVEYSFSAVNEMDERAYFIKTQAERKQWFARGGRKPNQRGQDKLISRVLKKNVRKVIDEHKSPVIDEQKLPVIDEQKLPVIDEQKLPVIDLIVEQPSLTPKSTHTKFSSDSEEECS